jgi:hypothetical protein
MNNLSLKEVQIIFGYLYNVTSFTKYVSGYRKSYQEYDVREDVDSIRIYYAGTSDYNIPVSRAWELPL